MIHIEALRFGWPRATRDCLAIDRLTVERGQAMFLHGPSGSGKSTLLSLLAGVLVPREGRICIMDLEWSALPVARRDAKRAHHIGYIFQQFNLLTYLSALENVILPCRFSAVRRDRASQRSGSVHADAQTLLERIGMDHTTWNHPAGSLSVGQQQRVAAARALVGSPEIVIADEPTSALDAPLRDSFLNLLLNECRLQNSTLVFVSHDERLACRFDTQVSLLEINGIRPHKVLAS